MADAISQAVCIERHRRYPYDIAARLRAIQVERLRAMFAPILPGESVLDVGCNSGYIVDFVPASCHCHGVEVAPELVAKAAERLVSAQVAAAESLPFEEASIDVVALGEVLEHVFDPVAVVMEATRVARRLVVGSTPHESSQWGPQQRRGPESHQFHVRCFTEATLRDALWPLRNVQIGIVRSPDGAPQFYVFEGAP